MRSGPIYYPEVVARLRAALNAAGWDAPDLEIQQLYSEWSEEYWAAGWSSLSDHGVESFVHWINENAEEAPRV